MKHLLFFLIIVVGGSSFALDAITSQQASSVSTKKQLACPTQNFSDFLDIFSESEEVQKAFTQYPLTKQQINFDAKPYPKLYTKNLGYQQISFPLVPDEATREAKSLSFIIDQDSIGAVRKGKAFLTSYTGMYITYSFEKKKGCWRLTSMNDQSLSDHVRKKGSWLQNIFPSPINCTPQEFYYESMTGVSANRLLENKNYSLKSIDDELAKYKIREIFFGLPAVELEIPAETYSAHIVSISASAEELAKNIRAITGANLDIHGEGKKDKKIESGVAYIVADSATTSKFVCFTFETQGSPGFHFGRDFAAPRGTPIPAAASGKVYYKKQVAGYGNIVVIEHHIKGEKIYTLYAHMDKPSLLKIGDLVSEKDSVGYVGNTGVRTNPHFHFEIIKDQPYPLKPGHKTYDPKYFDFPGNTNDHKPP